MTHKEKGSRYKPTYSSVREDGDVIGVESEEDGEVIGVESEVKDGLQ